MPDNESFADLQPIVWKWLVRLIWLGSIGFFQAVELHRHLSGQSYRPFFGLYAGVLSALVAWFALSAATGILQRKRARLQSRSTAS